MKNPFEAPKTPPQEDESVDIDLSDLEEKPEFGSGMKEFEPGEIAKKHEELGKAWTEEREKEARGYDAVSESYFAKNPFLVERFKKDPQAGERFRRGLKSLIITSKVAYHCEPEDLPNVPGFQKDLAVYAMKFEEDEQIRKMSGRKAA